MSGEAQIERLPVRPRPKAGESLSGYCWRVFAANGYPLPVGFRSKHPIELSSSPSLLIGNALTRKLYEPERTCKVAKSPRFCPACVRDHGVHVVIWDMPHVTACGVHQCELLDRCTSCDRPLTWRTLGAGFCCPCGVAVVDMPAAQARTCDVAFALILLGAIDAEPRFTPTDVRSRAFSTIDYSRSHVYRAIEWANRFRLAVNESTRTEPIDPAQTVKQRTVLGRWATGIVAGLPGSLRKRSQWLYRQAFRHEKVWLVRPEASWRLRTALSLRERIATLEQPLAKIIVAAIDEGLAVHSIGVASLPGVLFHPCLSVQGKAHAVDEFAQWWAVLGARIQRFGRFNQLDHPYRMTLPVGDEQSHLDGVLRIINPLFDAALRRVHPDAFELLVQRWQVSPDGPREAAGLGGLADYLVTLHPGELAYVEALARQCLRSVPPPVSQGSNPWSVIPG